MICRFNDAGNDYTVFMEPLKESQEVAIEEIGKIQSLEGNKDFGVSTIYKDDIYLFGDVDLNNDEDIRQIADFNLLDRKVVMPTKFKYETGTAITENNVVKVGNPSSAVEWFKFCHTKIGKPKKIVVYRIHASYLK